MKVTKFTGFTISTSRGNKDLFIGKDFTYRNSDEMLVTKKIIDLGIYEKTKDGYFEIAVYDKKDSDEPFVTIFCRPDALMIHHY